MSTTLWGKCHYAKCFGHWLVSDPECAKCALSDNCEKRTKNKAEDNGQVEEEIQESGSPDSITPIDYLLRSLSGKFDAAVEEKEKAVLHKFSENGKLVAAIAIGSLGKIKVVSLKKNFQKVYGGISSIEEAEEILSEMV